MADDTYQEDHPLTTLARELCGERDEALQARQSSGLDDIWRREREQYQGIDEVNRGRAADGKSATLDGPATMSTIGRTGRESRSTVFLNITRPYTGAGTSLVADILSPTGKMPWDLKPTPVSDIQILRAVVQENPQLAPILESFPSLASRVAMDERAGEASIGVAKELIKDWLKETKWIGHVREQIAEAGKVGTGVLKGPFPQRRQVSSELEAFIQALPPLERTQLEARLLYTPGAECIKVENCIPDPACGSDIQNGRFFFEKVPDVSRRRLAELKEDPSYFAEEIDKCLEQGPKESKGGTPDGKDKKKPFTLYIRTGDVDLTEVADMVGAEVPEGEKLIVFATVVLCNECIIKISEPALEKKVFPYWLLRWEPREGSWAGIGIPEQIETPQRGLNASVRALMDNMGFSVGPQILRRLGLIEPADGDDQAMHPYKVWNVLENPSGVNGVDDPKQAMTFLEFPSYLDVILPVINFWLKMAEDTTGLPVLLQGQSSTDAVGVSQQMMNNATTNLRMIIRAWDDETCKPQIDCFYEWTQLYGPPEAKGDAVAEAIGSSVLLVKELQQQALLQVGDRALQPEFGLSPSRWMQTYLEGFQISYEQLQLTPEEEERLKAAAQQPDPKVQAEQIRAEVDLKIAEMRHQVDLMKAGLDVEKSRQSSEQAQEAVEMQVAGQIATAEMKKESEGPKAQEDGAPAPAPAPALDTDAALQILGFET